MEALQLALLPRDLPVLAGMNLAARYVAAEAGADVGGDWYAVLPLANDCLGLAVGDVAGHGLDAVAEMASVRFSLRPLPAAPNVSSTG